MNKGPFFAHYDLRTKKNGLFWIGSQEKCDVCGDEFSMVWIKLIGKYFVCKVCEDQGNHIPKKLREVSDYIIDCDSCHFDFLIEDLTINQRGDMLLCKDCIVKDAQKELMHDYAG